MRDRAANIKGGLKASEASGSDQVQLLLVKCKMKLVFRVARIAPTSQKSCRCDRAPRDRSTL